MRTLYTPSDRRVSPTTREDLDRTVPNSVPIEYGTGVHTLADAFAKVGDRLLGRVEQADPYPASASALVPAVMAPASPAATEPIVTAETLLFGPPSGYGRAFRRRYLVRDVFDDLGQVVTWERAVEATEDGSVNTEPELWLQDGDGRIYRLQDDRPVAQEGRTFTLVSAEPGQAATAPRSSSNIEVEARVEGFAIELAEQGTYDVTFSYDRTAAVDSGDSVTSLPDFAETGALWRGGDRVQYDVAAGVITFTGGTATLYYRAERVYTYTPSPWSDQTDDGRPRISIQDLAEKLERLPTHDDVTAIRRQDTVAEITMPGTTEPVVLDRGTANGAAINVPDGRGTARSLTVSHQIQAVIPTRFHLVVAGSSAKGAVVSVIEPYAYNSDGRLGRVVVKEEFVDVDCAGLTWTCDGELGLVVDQGTAAGVTTLEVWALTERRRGQSGGYTVPSA